MDALLVFLLVIALISITSAKNLLPPFLSLIGGALVYGILTGLGSDVPILMMAGIGAVFALLGIPIYCGSLIAQIMRGCGHIDQVAEDLVRLLRRRIWVSGVAGYLLSIPYMCCITAFVILTPVLEHLGHNNHTGGKSLYYIAAYGSVLSFVLLYPLPVSYAIISTLALPEFNVVQYLAVAFPVSAVLLILALVASRTEHERTGEREEPKKRAVPAWRLKAWAPILVPIVILMAGSIIPFTTISGTISIALLAGATAAILLADRPARVRAFERGTRNAGTIMFDLCGAGALGSVIAASPLAETITGAVNAGFPALFIPFAIAALFQTAQGSRVVTAIATSSLLAGSEILLQVNQISLVFMIAAGTLVISFVTDPYFWLIKRTTNDDFGTVVKRFTLPLAGTGFIILMVGMACSLTAW